MAKYMIHTYEGRRWYVDGFIVPSMLEQGINEDDIYIYQDTGEGNLKAFIHSCESEYTKDLDSGIWHLQDDVVLSSTFKERTEKYDKGLVCGFTSFYDAGTKVGILPIEDMWWSFPCIRIPNLMARKFTEWVNIYFWRDPQFEKWIKEKKYDDLVFKTYVTNYHKNEMVNNLAPNLVDHVDYLLGGSVVNTQRKKKIVRSIFWDEEKVIKDLEKKLKNFQKRY